MKHLLILLTVALTGCGKKQPTVREYFINYGWQADNGSGYGSTIVGLNFGVRDYKDVQEIERFISTNQADGRTNFKCIVLNWKLLPDTHNQR